MQQLELPEYATSNILNFPQISHRFFYKKNRLSEEVDFASLQGRGLAERLIQEFDLSRLLVLNQNHSVNIAVYPSSGQFDYCDGIFTDQKKTALLIRHADCQAALIFDPVKNVIGAVHAGFRGQAAFIYTHAIQMMQDTFNSDVKDIRVAISPSLGQCHSEFKKYTEEFPSQLHGYVKNMHMDLKKMALDEFLNLGILKEHIDVNPLCTFDDEEKFFSYRKTKTSKRLASLIVLNGHRGLIK